MRKTPATLLLSLIIAFAVMPTACSHIDEADRLTVINVVEKDTKDALPSDPRQAYKAVRRGLWKKVLGGNINILTPRKAGERKPYNPPRKLKAGQRGGNRVKRSQRTEDLMTYWGKDRGFVLRFLNSGTDTRKSRLGNRGSIAARQWFRASAETSLDLAAENIGKMIDEELVAMFNAEQK